MSAVVRVRSSAIRCRCRLRLLRRRREVCSVEPPPGKASGWGFCSSACTAVAAAQRRREGFFMASSTALLQPCRRRRPAVSSMGTTIASNRFMSSSPLQEDDETKKKKRMEEKKRRKKLGMALMKEQPSPSSLAGDEKEMKSIEELFGLLEADIRSPEQIKRVQELRSAVERKKEELVRLLLKEEDDGHGGDVVEQEIKEKTEELAAAARRLRVSVAPQGLRVLMKRCKSLEDTREAFRLAGTMAWLGVVGFSLCTHFLLS